MKKLLLGVAAALSLVLMGCETEPSVKPPANPTKRDVETELFTGTGIVDNPEDPSTSGVVGDDWGYGIPLEGSLFADAVEGDTIVIHVRGIPADGCENPYSRLYLRTVAYENAYFEKVSSDPYLSSTSKNENGSLISRFQLEANTEYTITVTLTSKDIEFLKTNGLKLCGPNSIVHDAKLIHTEYSYKDLDEQYQAYKEYRESIISKYSKKYDTPMIFITTEGRQDIKKKEYYNSVIDVVNCDAEYKLSAEGGVKVRGNSTANDEWSPNQKPLRIKFEEKHNMLGLHNGKKYKSWVLLKAGGFNPMDYMGFNLAHEIYKTSDLKYYASDCKFVHVFINEEYKGQYLLCEQNQVNGGRVDVDENKAKSTSEKVGYMIELDNYAWEDLKDGKGRWFGDNCSQGEEDYHFGVQYLSDNEEDNIEMTVWGNKQTGVKLTDVNGETRGCIGDDFTLKNDIYSDSQVEFIKKYTKNLWYICYEAIEKNHFCKFDSNYDVVEAPEYTSASEVCAAVIDLDSLCNEMILEELVRDNDVGAGSLYMAIDFTKPIGAKYNKFTFECPWDFNWAYQDISNDRDKGAYWNGKTQYFAGAWQTVKLLEDEYDRSHPWFILFNNAPWFRKMLRARWEKIGFGNLKTVTYNVDKAGKAACKDIAGDYQDYVSNFVRNRIDYINRYLWKE